MQRTSRPGVASSSPRRVRSSGPGPTPLRWAPGPNGREHPGTTRSRCTGGAPGFAGGPAEA
eukprot:154172-Alexandrium_andersonii.AAC.1